MTLLSNTKTGLRDNFSGVDGTSTATVDKLNALYLKSGSTKTFVEWMNDLKKSQNKKETPILDWLKSDSAKQALGTAQGLVDKYKQSKNGGGVSTPATVEGKTNEGEPDSGETTIFGFHPITFGIGAILILVGGYLGTRYIMNKNAKVTA